MLQPPHAHAHPAQPQPVARAEEREGVEPVSPPREPRRDDGRRPDDEQQHRGHEQRPPVPEPSGERAPRRCARLGLRQTRASLLAFNLCRKTFRMHPAFLRRPSLFAALALALCCLTFADAQAQRRRPSRPPQTPPPASVGTPTSPAGRVPPPREVLGFTPGDDRKVADWKQITDYFGRLNARGGRVRVQTVGESTLGRPLIAAFISSLENIRDLHRYPEIQRRLT